MAGSADPGRIGPGESIPVSHLQKGHQLPRQNIQMLGHRAGAGAGAALETLAEVLAADLSDSPAQLVVNAAGCDLN
jgi:hypothetical protein